jgi:hypothetical protein
MKLILVAAAGVLCLATCTRNSGGVSRGSSSPRGPSASDRRPGICTATPTSYGLANSSSRLHISTHHGPPGMVLHLNGSRCRGRPRAVYFQDSEQIRR